MNIGLIIVLAVLIGFMSLLLYLNSKAKLGKDWQYELSVKQKTLRNTINVTGLVFYVFALLDLLVFAIGVIFFQDSFLPR